MDNQFKSHTLVTYDDVCYNKFLKEPLFLPEHVHFALQRDGEEPLNVRMSRVVFRPVGTEEWLDDPVEGCMEAMVLGDGDEQVEPVTMYNLPVAPEHLIELTDRSDLELNMVLNLEGMAAQIDGKPLSDPHFVLDRQQMGYGHVAELTLQPAEGQPFVLHIAMPFEGFGVFNEAGEPVSGNLDVTFEQIMQYTYKFKGEESADRFVISFNNDKKVYQYILAGDGKLSIRDKRDKMNKVGETDCEGRLALLLQGIPHAVIKYKANRWRINVIE